jgi:hypothetical protein
LDGVNPGLLPAPPGFSFAQAATAAFLTAAGTVVGGFLEFGLNLGNVKPWAVRQFWYAARARVLTPVVVVAWPLARLVDDDPQDASPSATAAKVNEAVIFPALPRGRRYLLAVSAKADALLISIVNLLDFKFITRF